MNKPYRWPQILFSILGAKKSRRSLSIFIFHRVLAERDPLVPTEPIASEFDQIISWINSWFEVLPLDNAVDLLNKRRLPPRAACITFDDGYADNFSIALPILQRHRTPATFFIATGFLNGGRMWNDSLLEAIRATRAERVDFAPLGLTEFPLRSDSERRSAAYTLIATLKHRTMHERADAVAKVADICSVEGLPNDLMMTDEQVRGLHAVGMGIGAHTVSHPILARCDRETAAREMAESRDYLEGLIHQRVRLFAYPNGKIDADYSEADVKLARDLGFDGAVTTNPGVSRYDDDLFQLRRFTPWERSPQRFAARLFLNALRSDSRAR